MPNSREAPGDDGFASLDYFRKRLFEEKLRAHEARDIAVATIHARLARAYHQKINGLAHRERKRP